MSLAHKFFSEMPCGRPNKKASLTKNRLSSAPSVMQLLKEHLKWSYKPMDNPGNKRWTM